MKNNNIDNVLPERTGAFIYPKQKTFGNFSPDRKDGEHNAENQENGLDIYNKPVIINAKSGDHVDNDILAYHLYNCFNYSLFLPEDQRVIRCSLGITSPNKGEGKTTAACNLAAAISLGSNRKTVIVDLNFSKPRLHEIFGTPQGPGVAEALLGKEIFVTPTQIENLYLVPAGRIDLIPTKKLSNFSRIASSLLREFEFIIVDMPSLGARSFPTIIANQLSGLIVVVEARRTKRRDVDRLFRQVHERNVVGFVLNKVMENDF